MGNTISSNIAGIDGIVPIYQPNLRWSTWALNEIYLGQEGQDRYVPNVKDYVVNTDTDQRWKVVAVDPTTLIPTLDEIIPENVGAFSDYDILLGVGPGTQSDTYRVYLDKSVMPHTLSVDARLKVAGSMVTKAMIFKGSELSGTSKVISALYDQTGTLLGQAIPLELVAMEGNNNISVKTVPVCHTLEELPDGEVVTAVFYSDNGRVVSKRQLLIENTAFIRNTDASVKYIIGISLESPFLSHSDNRLIQYPLNVPLNGLGLIGVVQYSDGSKIRLPVDGTKFSIFGFEGYLSSIIGQKFNLVLKYSLSVGEVVYGSNVADGQFITQKYKATTVKADGAYTVKLYGYPVWVDAINGYVLEWFMYDLNRNNFYRVTPYVKFNTNTRAFNPTLYGINQQLSVSINLKDVNGSFTPYIHAQIINISLMGPGTERTTNWTVGFTPNQDPQYGQNNFAATTFINQNLWKVKLDSGYVSLASWLEHLYYNTLPLSDSSKEAVPPAPNYFTIVVGNDRLEFPISQWNQELTISDAVPDNTTLFISFFLRTPDNDIHLSIAGLPIYQTVSGNNNGGGTPATVLKAFNIFGAGIPDNGNNAGTGYLVNDVITFVGGVYTEPVQLKVISTDWINPGGIGGFVVLNSGNYTVQPTQPITVTGGSGTGATFTGEFHPLDYVPPVVPVVDYYTATVFDLNDSGTGYSPGDLLTLVGGTPNVGYLTNGTSYEIKTTVQVQTTDVDGSILLTKVIERGQYVTPPDSPILVTGGTGSGAKLVGPYTPMSNLFARYTVDPNGGVTIVDSGLGYEIGDALEMNGGVFIDPAILTVTGIDGNGAITELTIYDVGSYSNTPQVAAISLTGGSGSGATVTVYYLPV